MAKKITARKNRVIKGQPHKLAYINDAEEGLLLSLGGSGEMVDGVPAFFDGFGDNRSQGGFGGRGRDYDGGGNDRSDEDMDQSVQQDIAAAAAEAAGIDMGGYNYDSGFSRGDNAQAIANTMNAVMGGNVNQQAQAALERQLKNARNNYGLPMTAGAVLGAMGKFTLGRIEDVLAKGGRPQFDAKGNLAGAYGPGLFGGEVYTGNQVAGIESTGYSDDDGRGPEDRPQVKNPNPLTGVCEPGYVFDDDLQACRLDTGSSASDDAAGGNYGVAGERYYRPTALDTPSAFQPSDFDFARANYDFVNSFAYDPRYYERDQMDVTGMAPVSGLLV